MAGRYIAPALLDAVRPREDVLAQETLATDVQLGAPPTDATHQRELEIDGDALVLGFTLGRLAREAPRPWPWRRLVRRLVYPVLFSGAAGMVLLEAAGSPDGSRVILSGVVSYWAALDVAYGILPNLAAGVRQPDDPRR